MKLLHRCALLIMPAVAGLSPTTATAAARCEVVAESMAAHPPSVGEKTYSSSEPRPAHDVHLQINVGPDGKASNIIAESTQDPKPARRSASLWRYSCEGNNGGRAEWILHYVAQQCRINISSKNLNPPRYPMKAIMADEEGTVILALQPQGNDLPSARAYVAKSSGSALLDEAALEASKHWSFYCDGPIDDSEPAQEVSVRYMMG